MGNSVLHFRWAVVGVFIISSILNYLDRALLAALAPLIMAEFHFNQTGYGELISVFSIVYAVSSIGVGWFLDRVGVNRGITAAAGWWSAAAVSTGAVGSYGTLALCRSALALGESAGVPSVGKINGMYLKVEERALGAAVNQIGISVGSSLAPAFTSIALAHTWRVPFILSGLMGFVWIPIWAAVSKSFPPPKSAQSAPAGRTPVSFRLLADPNLLLLVLANALWMPSYSLWSNWTTLYIIHVHHLSLDASKHYAWIPPLISNLGGFFGGWLSLRWMRRGTRSARARTRAVWISLAGLLLTLTLPAMPDPFWATAAISVSFFFALAGSVNIYALPIDLFGPERTGLAIAALGFAYGVMQMVLSPVVGRLSDHGMYSEIVWLVTLPPLLSALVLQKLTSRIEADRSDSGA